MALHVVAAIRFTFEQTIKAVLCIIMFKIKLILSLILFSGCTELINVTGIFINRAAIQENYYTNIMITINNPNKNLSPNFKVSIIQDYDSSYITNPVFSSKINPVTFIFPDNQINPINRNTINLLVCAEYPGYNFFQHVIPVSKLYDDKLLLVEFNTEFTICDTLPPPPIYLYKQFKCP